MAMNVSGQQEISECAWIIDNRKMGMGLRFEQHRLGLNWNLEKKYWLRNGVMSTLSRPSLFSKIPTKIGLCLGILGHKFLTDEEDFLEAATGVMRSVLEKLSALNAPQV